MRISATYLSSHKTKLQALLFVLVVSVLGLAIARLTDPATPPSRMKIWIVVVALKSIIVLLYEVTTERAYRFRRFASTKANMILNCIEPVFWFTGFVLTIMSIKARCLGLTCALGVIITFMSLILTPLSIVLAIVAIREHRQAKGA